MTTEVESVVHPRLQPTNKDVREADSAYCLNLPDNQFCNCNENKRTITVMLEMVAWSDPEDRTLVFWRMKCLRQYRFFSSLTDFSPGVLASIWANPMYSFLHWEFDIWQFITSFKALHKAPLLLRFRTASSNFPVKHLFNFLNSELPQVPMTSLLNWTWFLMKFLMHTEFLWGKELRCWKRRK